MAKQSGLHQIKGKVGEYSYYKQTGVPGGLIRSINQGLSARVKGGAEYANTRLNNREFAAACNVAGLLGKTVVPKFRPMILPMSQSKMAKDILKVARDHAANWGQRVVTSDDTAKLCEILTAMSKRDYLEFIKITLSRTATDVALVDARYTAEQATLMASFGINKLTVTSALYDLATGQWVAIGQTMTTGYMSRFSSTDVLSSQAVVAGQSGMAEEDLDAHTFVPAPNHSGHQIVVSIIMPERDINGVSHILQEYCSFVAMPLPSVA